MLTVSNLTKRFGGFTAVDHVSFALEQGEILGLIGPNGSGKSTTFNLIAGTLAPSEGSISFLGQEIGGQRPMDVCHLGIARTLQIPRPFKRLSILENVAVAAYYGQHGRGSRQPARGQAEEGLGPVNLPAGGQNNFDAATFALSPSVLSISNSFFGPRGLGTVEADTADWLAAQSNVRTGDPKLNGFLPAADSPLLTGGQSLPDPYFRPTSYVGAFAGPHDNWTAGWSVRLPR